MTLCSSTFSARTVKGSGRGKDLGTPTINLERSDVPSSLNEGIYACKAELDDRVLDAVMHYGPRPVFHDTDSCEVHILDEEVLLPERLTVHVIAFLRPVEDFASPALLMAQIKNDIDNARAILATHEAPHTHS